MKKVINSATLGITIGMLFSIFFSYLNGNKYYISSPKYIENFSNESIAVLVAIGIFAIIGIVFHLLSYFYSEKNVKKMGLIKSTVLHFLLGLLTIIITGSILKWFDISLKSILSLFITYIAIYIIIWTVSYLSVRNEILKINEKINKRK